MAHPKPQKDAVASQSALANEQNLFWKHSSCASAENLVFATAIASENTQELSGARVINEKRELAAAKSEVGGSRFGLSPAQTI
jgi:hypothetical protein